MNEVLYGIDYLEYYFYWIYYKFMGYPLIIRICTAVVMLCIFAYFCLLINIIYGIFKRKREKRKYAKIHKRYYEKLKEISLNTNHLTDEEIANIVEYNEKKRIKSNEIRIITQLLAEIKTEFEDQINELNFQGIQNVFQITRYFERELQFGPQRSKIQTLKLIQSINGYASEAVLVRFLYHRELELRNSARYAYMWLSQGNPFRFFDEDAILEHRKKAGYATPSFIKWVNTSAEEDVKKFFINEIRFYNETESAPILAKQINARSPEIRSEIIRALGTLKYKEIEPKLFEMYNTQPEDVKQNIIAAVLELGTGNAVDFLKNAYEEADNWSTKRSILKALYGYNEAGRQMFNVLETQANAHTAILFAHTKDLLINQIS